MRRFIRRAILPLALLTLVSCGSGGDTETPAPAPPAEKAAPPAPPEPDAGAKQDDVVRPDADGVVRIAGYDELRFDVTRFEVKSGEKLVIEFRNAGKQPKEIMAHNLPPDRAGDVVAATKLLGPGETERLELVAPAPGTYRYICTFPGHYAVMQGEMVVL